MARALVVVLLLALLCPAAADIRFFVLGDWGSASIPEYAPTQLAVAKSMNTVAKQFSPLFITSTGDNFYEQGVPSPDSSIFDDGWQSIYDGSALNDLPWYMTLGNHDWMGSVSAQLQYAGDERWRLPNRYYATSFVDEGMNVTLIFLDTTPLIKTYYDNPENDAMKQQLAAQNAAAQLSWFQQTLHAANTTSRWVIVIGHHPVISAHQGGSLDGPESGGFPDLQAKIQPLLEQYQVHAYVCGHVHNLQHMEANGVNYFISGAGSRLQMSKRDAANYASKFWAEVPGFMSIVLTNDTMTSTFYDTQAQSIYSSLTYHNETTWIPNGKILGLSGAVLFCLVLGGVFAVIAIGVGALFVVRGLRRGSAAEYEAVPTADSGHA